jgi:hypothetical protein
MSLLGVTQRDAGDALLSEEHSLEHRDRDEQGRRAQLAEHAAAEGFQVRHAAGLAQPG